MRAFVALELPAAVGGELRRRIERLRPSLPPARWVAQRNLHLTLMFLGEITASQEGALAARLTDVFQRRPSFELQLAAGGCFPRRRPARVVWVGVEPVRDLLPLRRDVADACRRELPLAPERRSFHPHFTVARCRRPWPERAAERWSGGLSGAVGRPFAVLEGLLMESRLDPAGASYRVRARLPLGKGR